MFFSVKLTFKYKGNLNYKQTNDPYDLFEKNRKIKAIKIRSKERSHNKKTVDKNSINLNIDWDVSNYKKNVVTKYWCDKSLQCEKNGNITREIKHGGGRSKWKEVHLWSFSDIPL